MKPGAVLAACSSGEAASGAPNAPPTGRSAANTWPLTSEPGAIRTQLTTVALPLPAAPSPVTGWAAGDSGCDAPKRPSAPVTDTRTRVLAPFGVEGAPGSPPTHARTAPRPSPWTSAGALAATPSACSRRWAAPKRVAPTGRTHASTSSGPVSPPSESWRWTSAIIARPPLVMSAASSLSVPDATAPRSWIGPQLPFGVR